MLKFAIKVITTVGILASMSSGSFVLNDDSSNNRDGKVENAVITRRNTNISNIKSTNNNTSTSNNSSNSSNNDNDPFALYDPFKDQKIGHSSNGLSQLIDPFQSLSVNLKVATFNIWGLVTAKDRVSRVEAIARYFTKNPRGIDILCLQEVWMSDDYRTIRASLSLEFPHAHYFKSGVVGSGLAVFSKYPIKDAWWKGFTLTGKAH